MKKTFFVIFLLSCSSFVFSQTKKEENFNILISNVWTEDAKNKQFSEKMPEKAKPIYKDIVKQIITYYKPNGIKETYNKVTKELISTTRWALSEDGIKMILKSGEDASEPFEYAIELKEISKKRFVFGKSDNKQYSGFVNHVYISANE